MSSVAFVFGCLIIGAFIESGLTRIGRAIDRQYMNGYNAALTKLKSPLEGRGK